MACWQRDNLSLKGNILNLKRNNLSSKTAKTDQAKLTHDTSSTKNFWGEIREMENQSAKQNVQCTNIKRFSLGIWRRFLCQCSYCWNVFGVSSTPIYNLQPYYTNIQNAPLSVPFVKSTTDDRMCLCIHETSDNTNLKFSNNTNLKFCPLYIHSNYCAIQTPNFACNHGDDHFFFCNHFSYMAKRCEIDSWTCSVAAWQRCTLFPLSADRASGDKGVKETTKIFKHWGKRLGMRDRKMFVSSHSCENVSTTAFWSGLPQPLPSQKLWKCSWSGQLRTSSNHQARAEQNPKALHTKHVAILYQNSKMN